jgi:UDP-hydrolysing UDP-N-acetyl-D-glucosamine 2-epimerase
MTAIVDHPELRLRLMVTGMHLSPRFGLSVGAIERDGFSIDDRVEMLAASDGPEAVAASMGSGTIGFARAFARQRPDAMLVAGDRFETHAAVVAALPFNIPVAHIHGGESTEGAIDEAMRHSITKMSHLHFAATDTYAARIRQMGEEPWRVVVSGAPSLDTLRRLPRLCRPELEARVGIPLAEPVIVATYHPVTREYVDTECHIRELLAALEQVARDATLVFTYPNADTSYRTVIEAIRAYASSRAAACAIPDLGSAAYFSLLDVAAAMIGNSSSGIVESASFKLPVVNVGNRQRGRVAPSNVLHAGNSRNDIAAALRRVLSPDFRKQLRDLVNPYGDGHAADRIVEVLARVDLDERLLMKRFAAA